MKQASATSAETSVAVSLSKKSERPVSGIGPHIHRKQLRADPLDRADVGDLEQPAELQRSEDRRLRHLAVAAVIIRAMNGARQKPLGRQQHKQGKDGKDGFGKSGRTFGRMSGHGGRPHWRGGVTSRTRFVPAPWARRSVAARAASRY